jgi:hypothetical protein
LVETGLENDSTAIAPKRQPVLGRVYYNEDIDHMLSWVTRVVALFGVAAAWIWVGTWSGVAAVVGCVVIWAAIGYVKHWAIRLLVIVLAVALPVSLVIVPEIRANDHLAEQAAAARAAADKPYADAVVATKADLENQGFSVYKLSLNREDMTRGDAELRYNLQRGTSYASVILIMKGDRWTVNCPTATGELVDVNVDNYTVGRLLYVAGECPAGYVPAPTP